MMKYQVRRNAMGLFHMLKYVLYFLITLAVRLSSNVSSVRESDEFVLFTLISSFPPEDPFTVQVFTRERNRTSATSVPLHIFIF